MNIDINQKQNEIMGSQKEYRIPWIPQEFNMETRQ